MNEKKLKKDLEKTLRERGMQITIDGEVINPPDRSFKNLGEEILQILNEAKVRLTSNDFAKYLKKDIKIIQKVLSKLTNTKIKGVVQKEKIGNKYFYTADFNKSLDIPTTYELIRKETTKSIR